MQTNKFEITTIEDLIFRVEFFQGVEIELSDAEIIFQHFRMLANGQKYCVLLDASKEVTTSPEARAYVANQERSSWKIAFAIVTNTTANKLVGNFFIQFNKPVSPTKLFTNEEAALKWIEEQKEIFESNAKLNQLPTKKA